MVTPKELIIKIVIDILQEPISSEKNYLLGGSKNTFKQCISRNIGVGKKVIKMLHNLIKKHPEKSSALASYLNEFLTIEEKNYFKNKNNGDTNELLDAVINKINNKKISESSFNTSSGSDIRILTIFELQNFGWTIERYMKDCFKLWDDYTSVNEDFGTIQQWSKIISTHPQNRRILINNKNELIGFWDFVTLFEEDYLKAKKGILVDADFNADKMPFFLPGHHNILVTSIMLRRDYRGMLLKNLLFSILDAFEQFASEGIFIDEILTWAYSDNGISLSRSLGLEFLCKHKEEGEIYVGNMKTLLNNPLVKEFKILKKLYNENF